MEVGRGMTDDRRSLPQLQRLDALFAERVLGWPPLPPYKTANRHDNYEAWRQWEDLPSYTRSLDEAWEGLKRTEFEAAEPTIEGTATGSWRVWLFHKAQANEKHPAEALVLACLRAVGVSEEELA